MRFRFCTLFALSWHLAAVAAIAAADTPYHPNQISLEIPGVEQAEPKSYLQIVDGEKVWVFHNVAQATFETAQFLQYMQIRPGETVLDIGTGSGVLALFAAKTAAHVVATDIDPLAVENTRYNVALRKLESKIDVRHSDLFAAIDPKEKFDVILFNVGDPGLNNSPFFWELQEKFLSQAKAYLNPNGRIYSHSGYVEHTERMRQLVEKHNFKIIELHMWTANQETREPMLFVLQARH